MNDWLAGCMACMVDWFVPGVRVATGPLNILSANSRLTNKVQWY